MAQDGKSVFWIIKRTSHVLLLAFMLGLWNTIMQETRMINDSATRIELDAEKSDDPPE